MTATFNWGVIGPGRIAHKFADAVSFCPDARIFAVASRSIERADRYGDAWEIDCRYDNYEELVICFIFLLALVYEEEKNMLHLK